MIIVPMTLIIVIAEPEAKTCGATANSTANASQGARRRMKAIMFRGFPSARSAAQ